MNTTTLADQTANFAASMGVPNNTVMETPAATSTVVDPSLLMGSANESSLFDGLTEDDLLVPEEFYFLKGERVKAKILDISENSNVGLIRLELKILNTDHEGKVKEIAMFKPTPKADGTAPSPMKKKIFVQFLLALWTREEVLGGKVDLAKNIGKTIEFTSGQANEAKNGSGRVYQDYTQFEIVNEAMTNNIGL